jgi:hypothetical protein
MGYLLDEHHRSMASDIIVVLQLYRSARGGLYLGTSFRGIHR